MSFRLWSTSANFDPEPTKFGPLGGGTTLTLERVLSHVAHYAAWARTTSAPLARCRRQRRLRVVLRGLWGVHTREPGGARASPPMACAACADPVACPDHIPWPVPLSWPTTIPLAAPMLWPAPTQCPAPMPCLPIPRPATCVDSMACAEPTANADPLACAHSTPFADRMTCADPMTGTGPTACSDPSATACAHLLACADSAPQRNSSLVSAAPRSSRPLGWSDTRRSGCTRAPP